MNTVKLMRVNCLCHNGAKLVTVALHEQWWQRRCLLIFSSRLKLANKPNSKLIPPRHLNVAQKESNRTPPTTWPTYALNRQPGSCYPTPKCGCFRFGFATRIFPLPVWSHCILVGPKRKPVHANIDIAVGISLISRLGVRKMHFTSRGRHIGFIHFWFSRIVFSLVPIDSRTPIS